MLPIVFSYKKVLKPQINFCAPELKYIKFAWKCNFITKHVHVQKEIV